MIDSQIGKVNFGQRLKDGSKQVSVGVLFFITYNLKDSANNEKAITPLHQDNLSGRYFLLHQWFLTTAQEN